MAFIDKTKKEVSQSSMMQNRTVFSTIIQRMTKHIIDERIGIMDKAFNIYRSLEGKLKAARPDVEARYNADGEKVTKASYTKKTLEQRAQIKSRLDKIDAKIQSIFDFEIISQDDLVEKELGERGAYQDKDVAMTPPINDTVELGNYNRAVKLEELYDQLSKLVDDASKTINKGSSKA